MPQKRNPYALAVIRGGAGTLVGRATGLLATQATPSARTDNWLYAYGEVAGALELARRLLALGAAVVRTLEIDTATLAAAAGADHAAATDLAEELVLGQGIDYGSAYRVVASAVAAAGTTPLAAAEQVLGRPLPDGAAHLAALDPAAAVTAQPQPGGGSPEQVREHAAAVLAALAEARRWERERRAAADQAAARLVQAARRLAADPPR
jgi:argininosuccinate lyase